MKKILTLFVVSLLLIGCRAHYPVAQQGGKEDMAYLLFVSSKNYTGKTIEVTIDNESPFSAKVVKQRNAMVKGTQYGVATGTHSLKVCYNGKVLYQKKVFLSSQEVKQIMLP